MPRVYKQKHVCRWCRFGLLQSVERPGLAGKVAGSIPAVHLRMGVARPESLVPRQENFVGGEVEGYFGKAPAICRRPQVRFLPSSWDGVAKSNGPSSLFPDERDFSVETRHAASLS